MHAVWCDAKNNAGHAMPFTGATTIVTSPSGTVYHFCGPHTYDAFKKAMVVVGTQQRCDLYYPPVGDIVLTCENPVPTHPPATEPRAGHEADG